MSKRILIVDDNHEILRAASVRLQAAGYETIQACDGDQGIHSAAEGNPDAIVLDIQMPGKSGLDALAELKRREDTRHIPVVMLSANLVDQRAAMDSGARCFLRKPYDGRQLVDALQAVAPAASENHPA